MFFAFLVSETLLTREADEIVPLVLPPLDELDVELGVEGLPLDGLWMIRFEEADDGRPKPGTGEDNVRLARVRELDLSDLCGGVFGPKPIVSSASEFLLETDFLWPEEDAGLLLLSRSMLLDMSRENNSLTECLPGEIPLMELFLLSPRSTPTDMALDETSLTDLLDEDPRDSGLLVMPLAVISLAGVLRGEGLRNWTEEEEDTGLFVLSVASTLFDLAIAPNAAPETVCTGENPCDSGLLSLSLLSVLLLDKFLLGEFPLVIGFLGLSDRSTLLDAAFGFN